MNAQAHDAASVRGLVAEFASADELLAAARHVQRAGYRRAEAYAPFAIRGLPEALGMRRSRVALFTALGGLVGAVGGYFMQWYSDVIDYPLNIGGRPVHSWPAFIPIAFETMVLCAGVAAVLSLLMGSGLPRLNHPIFDVEEFDLATRDRFFLCLRRDDPAFDAHGRGPAPGRLPPAAPHGGPRMRRSIRGSRPWIAAACAMACLLLGGCERYMHNMYEQPRRDRDASSPLYPDGRASRPPVRGSVPRAMGDLAATSSGRRGEQAVARFDAAYAAERAPRADLALLTRGRQRFDIYCAPCHSPLGDGDGRVVRRGFPRPPSYHTDRLRQAPDRHFFDVITHGYGAMYPYADRVSPSDRWAIVAYIRALQRSQHAQAERAPARPA